jgi:hypothetical protein
MGKIIQTVSYFKNHKDVIMNLENRAKSATKNIEGKVQAAADNVAGHSQG